MKQLLKEIRACEACAGLLPNKPKPVIHASTASKIIIIGQAPGQKVQDSGIPWGDKSGKELRRWLNVTKDQFYNEELFALIPMGFCFPGRGVSGDLPPRPECVPLWHHQLLSKMKEVKLILLIGQYSQKVYLGGKSKRTLTENVKNHEEFLPTYFPLVHPSPRNNIWQKKNPWFELEIVPKLQNIIRKAL